METNKDEEIRSCEGCTLCCEYITIETSEPRTQDDVDHLVWYLLHGSKIYIDENNAWLVEMKKRCEALGEDGLCKIYEERPNICRDHSHDVCEKYYISAHYFSHIIKSREEFLEFLKKMPHLKSLLDEKKAEIKAP